MSAFNLKALDNLLGGTIAGLIYTSILLGAISIQVWLYFLKFPQDALWIKALVISLTVGQVLNLACVASAVWSVTIEGHLFLVSNPWNSSIYLFVNPISSVAVHCFFAGRIKKMTKTPWPALLVLCGSLSTLVFGLYIGILGIRRFRGTTSSYGDRGIIIGWCLSQAVTDLIIAGMMIFLLLRIRTGFSRTNRALSLMVTYAINSGLTTSLLAVASLILYCTYPHYPHFVYQSCTVSLGAVYTVTLLANLHARERVRARLRPKPGEAIHQSIHLSRLPMRVHRELSQLPTPPSRDGDEAQGERMKASTETV